MNLKLTVISSVSLVDISCIVNKCVLYYFLFLLFRPIGYWLSRAQSLLYCNEHGVLGSFSEEVKSCICPVEHPTCQGVIPCVVGTSSSSCSTCATDNATRCGACHHGNVLHLGSCRPNIAASLDHYLSLDLDMPDAEVLRIFYMYKLLFGSQSSLDQRLMHELIHWYWALGRGQNKILTQSNCNNKGCRSIVGVHFRTYDNYNISGVQQDLNRRSNHN